MRRSILNFITYYFLTTLIIFFCPFIKVYADTITLRADTWCPYNCDPKSDHPGYVIEIAKAIFEPAGHKVDYQTMPWSRTLRKVEAGKFVGAIGTDATEAPKLMFHTEEIGEIRHVFYVKKGNPWRYSGIDSLKKVSLGVILDYVYDYVAINPYIEANKTNPLLIQTVSGDDALEKNIHKLDLKRIDVILETATVFEYVIGKLGIPMSNYDEAGGIYKVNSNNTKLIPIFIGFSPKNPKSKEYAALLDAGMKRLRSSGELARIMARYNLKDWKVNVR